MFLQWNGTYGAIVYDKMVAILAFTTLSFERGVGGQGHMDTLFFASEVQTFDKLPDKRGKGLPSGAPFLPW